MDILMVAQYSFVPGRHINSRFYYIANELGKDNEVELVTSAFDHESKANKKFKRNILNEFTFKFTAIKVPHYKANVSLKRIYSNYVLAARLGVYLKKRRKPDVIYCGIPSPEVASVAARYASEHNIRFIIDIQDLWPEAYQMVFNVPLVSNLIFLPTKLAADYAYKQADEVIAVSETYCKRALRVNKKAHRGHSVFLGTRLEVFDQNIHKKKLSEDDGIIRLAYIGTLGHSYDLTAIFDAMKILRDASNINVKFVVMGSGPLADKFKEYSASLKLDVEFTGLLPYEEMIGRLTECDIAINPIMHNAAQSIINKVGDYAAAGLPVISTQENEEYQGLLEDYDCGFNCRNGNAKDIAKKIEVLVGDKSMRERMGTNNRRLAEERFDKDKSYGEIIDLVKDTK